MTTDLKSLASIVVLALLLSVGLLPLPSGVASGAEGPAPGSLAVRSLDDRVRGLLDAHGSGVVASVWVGRPQGDAWYSMEPEVARPTASSIKTAYLIALFARYADDLDHSPPGLGEVLRDDHPAMAPYSPTQRIEIRSALQDASVRTIGAIMMGSIEAPNHVYNAAASTTTALFGGPEGLTAAIHAIDPAFAPIVARRYMLAPRDVTGDNEATAASLAAVLARLAIGEIPGLDAEKVREIREAMVVRDDQFGLEGRHVLKGGSLNSLPITRVKSGWWEAPGVGPIVYVVMLARPDVGDETRAEASDRLEEAAGTLSALILKAMRDDHPRQ